MENKCINSAVRLYNHLFESFWDGHALVGPSAGAMLELRIYRFIKSYLSFINWSDNYCFMQTQGSWIKSNWELFEITGNAKYKKVAIACSDQVIDRQKDNGSWEYPLRSWMMYIATIDGTCGSLGLLETYKRTKKARYLESALRWHDFLTNRIGFETYGDSLAINYFDRPFKPIHSTSPRARVPNNTAVVLKFLAELYDIDNNAEFLKFTDKMAKFIHLSQNARGELKYAIEREHYLCYNYNAFNFLNLSRYYEVTKDEKMETVLEKLARYVSTGVTEMGSVRYNCFQAYPEVIYYVGAVGAALVTASLIGVGDYKKHAERAYNYLLGRQRRNGSFAYSRKDFPYFKTPISYGVLSDNRSYPRAQCHILEHLLIACRLGANLDLAV